MSGSDRRAGVTANLEQRRRSRRAARWAAALGCVAITACASTSKDSNFGGGAGGPDGSTGLIDSDSSSSTTGNDPNNSGLLGDSGIVLGLPSDDGATSVDGQTQVCTEAGCTCVRIASIGHAGVWGACGMNGDGTGAFEAWINAKSSATVDSYATKPTLTQSFLAQYDVIILQWLRDVPDAGGDGPLWQFSPDEVNALAAWVNAGGGLITMSGYDGDGQEVVPLNTLLSFSGFVYNQDGTYGSDCSGGSCWGGACGLTAWNTTSPIGAHLTDVGIQNGRSISVSADAGFTPVVDCPCPNGNDCAVHEDVGKGHVFAFTDEWVTYTSQWLGTASCIPSTCTGNTAADDFQVPQFWYNVISYASQSVQCAFTINSPMIIPK